MQDKKTLALWKHAIRVRNHAYAPYSKFKVGAALRDTKGRIFVGCNVENSSYGGTICAERAAIFAMVAASSRKFSEIVIVSNTPRGCPPCGFCRQVLAEFAANPQKTKVYLGHLKGITHTYSLEELLPQAFNANYLK